MINLLLATPDTSTVQLVSDASQQAKGCLQLTTCATANEAVDTIRRQPVDIVCAHLAIAPAILTHLAGQDHRPTIVVIASPHDLPAARRLLTNGIDDYLLDSPTSLTDLPYRASAILDNARLRRQYAASEAELNELRQRFSALADSTRDFIWEVDATGIYTYVSPQVQALLGYVPSEVIGRTPFDIMPPAEAARLRSKFDQISKLRRPISRWENTVRHKDGHLVMLETSGMPIIDDDDTFRGFRGIDRDITDRHRAETILRRREAILQAMAHASQRLLKPASSAIDIHHVLRLIGEAAEASRAYVFVNGTDDEGRAVMSQLYEWAAEDVTAEIGNPELQGLAWEPTFHDWQQRLSSHQCVHALVRDLAPELRELMESQDILSLLLVPIFEGDHWWGFVGLDDCHHERQWAPGEIDAIFTAARILGAGLQRQQWESKLHQLNECFLLFGPDPLANINRITALCGRLFGGNFAFYNRLEGEELCSWGQYNAPPDRPATSPARNHICLDVISNDQELYVPDLQGSPYADVDPSVRRLSLVAYYGYPVKFKGRCVGALCSVFCHPFQLTEDDRKLMAIMATAIGVEEDRRAGESELRQLATAIEQAAESMCITDLEGHIIYVNPAYEVTSGYTRDQLIGHEMPFLHSDQHDPEFFRNIWRTLHQGEVWSNRITNRRADGSIFYEDAVISPIRDGAGNISNYVAVKRDITKELELEEQLRHSQKMESVGRLAGGVAHDFNNLLSVIMGYADMTLANIPEEHVLYDMVQEIRKAGERATALTQQLLAFSRKQVLEVKSINLNVVIEDTRKMLQRLIGEDIELHTALDHTIANNRADAAQIQQILMNLVVNARDAMPGSGRIVIETTSETLEADDPRCSAELPEGPYIALRISDNGHGMDAETMKRIFDPFYTTKARGKGTGLGLATVHGIVMQHGGDIQVDSQVGVGTVFTILFPSEADAKELGNTTIVDKLECHGTETILVVEDDYNVLTMARRILEKYGYQVLAADGGQAAMRLVEEYGEHIHLLVSDVIMPRINGPELYERLRANYPSLKVIYMSGYTEASLYNRGIVPGEESILHKPFTIGSLTETVRMALDDDGDGD